MLKDTRMTSFLILHQLAYEKGVTWEIYQLWFLGSIIFFDKTNSFSLSRRFNISDSDLDVQLKLLHTTS